MSESYDAQANLKELLSRKPDDAKKPEALPAGTYFGTISRFKFDVHPFFKDEGDTPLGGTQLYLQLEGAEDSVMDELKESGRELSKKFVPYFIEMRKDGSRDWQHREFLKSCGIDTTGRNFGECDPELVGKRVLVELTRDMNKKSGEWVNNVRSVKGNPE